MPIYSTTKGGPVFSETRGLLKIRWVAPAANNVCILQDGNGTTIWQETYLSGSSTPETDFTNDVEPVQGLTVQQIDGGTLFLYTR